MHISNNLSDISSVFTFFPLLNLIYYKHTLFFFLLDLCIFPWIFIFFLPCCNLPMSHKMALGTLWLVET